jgi:hypothetical protein
LSWYQGDDPYYSNLPGLNAISDQAKKVVISNLIASYVETFAVNPDYWGEIPMKTSKAFYNQWNKWARPADDPFIPFIADESLSLFLN